jgi:hypothetical protein
VHFAVLLLKMAGVPFFCTDSLSALQTSNLPLVLGNHE